MILGVISSIESGGLQLLIDGEEEPTTKEYCYVASYLPIAGDRVLIEEINGTYVVIGKVVQSSSGETYADHAGYADTAGTADYATSAGTANTATYAVSAGAASSANTASYAVTAGSASYANSAYSCTTANNASYAVSAGSATYATNAGTATYATSSGTASTAVSATTADTMKDWNNSWQHLYFRIVSGELQFSTGSYYTWTTLQNK